MIIFEVLGFLILMIACWIVGYERGYKSGKIEEGIKYTEKLFAMREIDIATRMD